MTTDYDIIIIGAGIMGSATAHKLSKTGKKILLIEQFSLQHSNGSSHGQTRIIRQTYSEKHFSTLMKSAYVLWDKFEQEIGEQIIVNTGGIDLGPESSKNLRKTADTCKDLSIPYKQYNNRELNAKYQMFKLPDNYFGIVQGLSGIVLADRALSNFQSQAIKNNVKIAENELVVRIRIDTTKIIIETSKDKYVTDKLILTSGLWTNTNLASTNIKLDLNIWKLSFAYWPVLKPEIFTPGKFPIFIAWEENPFYGFPIIEYDSFIKLAPHFTLDENLSPETLDNNPNSKLIDRIGNYIEKNFQFIETNPANIQTCFYTMTHDENFILDFHPDSDQFVIGAGFSGHGFKFAPLIGDILADLALNQSTNYDIKEFSINRHLL